MRVDVPTAELCRVSSHVVVGEVTTTASEWTQEGSLETVVDVGGVKRQINISCIVDDEHPPQSCVGDWVLVHVGFAMSRINEQEAARTLELLREMGEVQAELEAMRVSGRA